MWSTRYSCHILKEFEFFSTDFWKIIIYQISRKSVQWELSCSMRKDVRTDRQLQTYRLYVASSLFLQICERVYKPSDLTVAAIRSKCRYNVTLRPWKKIWVVNGTVENKWQQFIGQCQLCVPHGTARSEIQLFLKIRGDSFSKLYELADHCNWDDEYDDIKRE